MRQFVNKKNFDNIKMHDMYVKTTYSTLGEKCILVLCYKISAQCKKRLSWQFSKECICWDSMRYARAPLIKHYSVHTVWFLNDVQLDYSVLCCAVG